jgi:hypothetical protein
VLAAFAVAGVAAGAAASNWYRLLRTLSPEQPPSGSAALLNAEMWFDNLVGWRRAALVVSVLLLVVWLNEMRGLADEVWPEGQRRSRAWLLFGWAVPVGNLFIPKMFVNDLWAAGQPWHQRERGHWLLTLWWFLIILAFGSSGGMLRGVQQSAHAEQAAAAMQQFMFIDGLLIAIALLTIAVVWRLSGMLERAVLHVQPVLPVGQAGLVVAR